MYGFIIHSDPKQKMQCIIFILIVIPIVSSDILPVRVLFVNDVQNENAEEVLNATLTYMQENIENFGIEVHLEKIIANGSFDRHIVSIFCDKYNSWVRNKTPPDLILDTTITGSTSESVKEVTAALGLPTVSTSFGQIGDIKGWRKIDDDQRKYLIQVMTPNDIIPLMIEKIVRQQKMVNAGILYDKRFVMDHQFKPLLDKTNNFYSIVSINERTIQKHIRKIHQLNIFNYFILGSLQSVETVLKAARNVSSLNKQYSWYVITEDTDDLTIYCKNCSILMIQPLINKKCVADMNNTIGLLNYPILTSSFYFDVFVKSIMAISRINKGINMGKCITCEEYYETLTTPPRNNLDLISKMKKENTTNPNCGLLNLIGNGGNFFDFTMEIKILRIIKGRIQEETSVGTWSSGLKNDLEITNEQLMDNYVSYNVYRVSVSEQDPLISRDENHPLGFNGYLVDMFILLGEQMKAKFEISLAPENAIGTPDENGTWNGLIGELINDKTDIGVAVYVTSLRDSAVDFTIPIYDMVGLSILMKKIPTPVNHFKFVAALENEVWLCIIAVYFFTSFLMWIFATFSPFSYRKNNKVIETRNRFEGGYQFRVFTLTECLWFCLTSLTPQGGETPPKNLSGRLLVATWYIFGFIIVSSYTANLAAFLTVSRSTESINSLEDLTKQSKLQYSAVNNSIGMKYFESMAYIEERLFDIWQEMALNDSLNDIEHARLAVWDYPLGNTYSRIWRAMKEAGIPSSLSEGIERVKNSTSSTEGFVLVDDALDIKYAALVNCDLMVIGEEFAMRPVAFALQDRSLLRKTLDENIQELVKKRALQRLKDKWWSPDTWKENCTQNEDNTDGISLQTMGSIFMLTFSVFAIGCIILVMDYLYLNAKHKNRNSKKSAQS